MTSDELFPDLEKKRLDNLKRRKRGKYAIILGLIIIVVSIFLGVLPAAVAAFSGTAYIPTSWESYLGIGIIFGVFLIIIGLISIIAPNMMEGDALWVMKTGPGLGGRG
ncbi:MAG: hypothetical protein ACFFF4_05815 [Candidatus Thorarchaeota archaeon]